jgi:hypothetical protein
MTAVGLNRPSGFLTQEALRCPPRFGTRRSLDRPTVGPAIGKVARALGNPPLPHQQYMYDVIGELDPETGTFAYDDVTLVGPRQVTGKTEFLLPLMTWRCTGLGRGVAEYARREFGVDPGDPPPQRVMYTAQRAEDARQKWRDVHVERIKASPFRADWSKSPRLRLAAEAMFWNNGSVWVPGSTTGKSAGTGDQLDLGVIDEAWAQTDGSTEIGMRPTMLTRVWRQLLRASMVPGPSRVPPERWAYLRQKMTAGRNKVGADLRKGGAYFEWSAPADADPFDEDVWWNCMPALGYTVPIRNVRNDRHDLDLMDFMAEYLGIWPTGNLPLWSTVGEQTWRDLIHGGQYQEPIAIGVDATPELTFSSIGMAAEISDGGDVHLELLDRKAGVNWLVPAILSLCRSQSVCGIGIDRNGPLAGIVRPLTRAADEQNLDITIVGTHNRELNNGTGIGSAEWSAACSQIYNMTGEQDDEQRAEDEPVTLRRVRHIAQDDLSTAVGGVVRHYHGDRWRWDRVGSATDVSPLNAVTAAFAAGESEEWIGGAYDVAKSLG